MVKLTFIRQAEKDNNDVGLTVEKAKRVYLLSKALRLKFGEPQFLYASKEFLSTLTASIANLGFCAKRVANYSAFNTGAQKREIRAFFDFILTDATYCKCDHIVVVCPDCIFKYAYIQLPPVGNSITICGDNWRNLLQGYTHSWPPLEQNKISVEDAKFITENIENAVCSDDELLLIKKTMQKACDSYVA